MRKHLLYGICTLLYSLLILSTAYSQLQKIYLHPKATVTEKRSQIIDSIRFIPLEINEGVDLSRYNYITITAGYFMVVDYPVKMIHLYSKKGAFVKKISYKKLGENFFPRYDDKANRLLFFSDNKSYTLTPKDRIQIMLDWNNPRNKKYFKKYVIDLGDTTFAIKKEHPTENDILGAYQHGDYYWRGNITTSPLYKDSLDYELKIYKDNQLVQGYFPYNRINEPKYLYAEESISWDRTDTPTVYFISRPYCDTVYKVVKDSLAAACKLVLPLENSLPASFYAKPFKNKTERENFRRNNGWMLHQVYGFYETQRFILLSVGYLANYDAYIYEKKTNVIYKTKNIKPDSSQYNLSLLGDFSWQRDGDRFYKSQKAGDLVAFFEQHKSVPVPKELEGFLKTKPAGNAPVIVEFKLKK